MSILFSCQNDEKKPPLQIKSKKEYRELMIHSHKAYLEKEKLKLDAYADSLGHAFQTTGSGLRYFIYEHSNRKDSIQRGDIAIVNYTLTLLNGDTAYQTLKGQSQEFIVAFDDVEAGLHEGIQKMAIDDKAILIIPAHLAHGISGDQASIPPQSPVVYDIELIGKK